MRSGTSPDLPAPWDEFLAEVDRRLPEPVTLHCLGGFVVAVLYGLARPTNDVDYVAVIPHDRQSALEALAGPDSALARRYRVHLQHVAVASLPDRYDLRLRELFPGQFERLRLLALDPYDLALSKLPRNHPVDREDVKHLARTTPLDAATLRTRYRDELRPIIIGNPERHDLTLEMWIEAYWTPPSTDHAR